MQIVEVTGIQSIACSDEMRMFGTLFEPNCKKVQKWNKSAIETISYVHKKIFGKHV